MPNDEGVLIIGAGIAGLAAAWDLTLAGRHVIVLEARDRIGGRIHTLHNAAQVPVELGAEFIHGKPRELLDVIDNARLVFCDVSGRHWYVKEGKVGKSGDFWQKLNRLMDQMKLSEPDRSFRDFLDSQPDDSEMRLTKSLAEKYVEGFHAARLERIGVHGLIKANEAEEAIEGESSFRVLEGYSSVVHWLHQEADRAGAMTHLNTVVKEIRRINQSVEAVCENGSFRGSSAIVTLPLGVLQVPSDRAGGVLFDPPLPQEKQKAIRALQMGDVAKIALRFRSRFWEKLDLPDLVEDLWELGFIHHMETKFPTWWTFLPLRARVIVGWVGGPDAEALVLTDQASILQEALTSLGEIFRTSVDFLHRELEGWHLHNWHTDEFSRGAYSYVPVNGLEAQQALARPVEKTLYFAGEATSVGHIGTVHGALASGQRAAKELLSDKL